jgi:hypothetical protein
MLSLQNSDGRTRIRPAAAARGESIFWVGGIENYKVQDLLDLHHFSRGELGNVKNKKLKADYKDYENIRKPQSRPRTMRCNGLCEFWKHTQLKTSLQ